MPHFIVEYAKPLEKIVSPSQLMQTLFQAAVETELFGIDDIKVRMQPFDHYTNRIF